MKEFEDLSEPWRDQFCPHKEGGGEIKSKTEDCVDSDYFDQSNGKMERIRDITYLQYHTGELLLWITSGIRQ